MAVPKRATAPRASMNSSRTTAAMTACRSTRRTACTARPATSRIPPRTSCGWRRRVAKAPSIAECKATVAQEAAMAVRRIVSNIGTSSIAEVRRSYETLFDLHPVMDHGWLVTLASGGQALTQIGIAAEGGSGTPVPDLSIEVDDVDDVYQRAKRLGLEIVYELTDEP